MENLENYLEKAERAMECAKEYRHSAKDEDNFVNGTYYASVANYYATRALFHQNKAIIELLRERKTEQT